MFKFVKLLTQGLKLQIDPDEYIQASQNIYHSQFNCALLLCLWLDCAGFRDQDCSQV